MNCTGVVGRAGREHVPAARDAVRPVREAAGGVVRTDDEPRPHDERRVAEGLLDDPLARRLARAVGLRPLIGLALRGRARATAAPSTCGTLWSA